MKTKFLLILFYLFLSSCLAYLSENEQPEIVVNQDIYTVWKIENDIETKITFDIKMSPDILNGITLKNLIISNENEELANIDLKKASSTVIDTFQYVIPSTLNYDTIIKLKFEVFDNLGLSDTYIASIDVIVYNDCGDYPIFVTYSGETLNFNNGNISNWNLSYPFLDLNPENVNVLNHSGNVSEIDIALAYDRELRFVLTSPNAPWFDTIANNYIEVGWSSTGKNHTKLQKISENYWYNADCNFFDTLTISENYIENINSNGVGVANLNTGDIVAFETMDGYKGILKVTNTSITTFNNLTCDIIISSSASSGK